MPKNEKTTELAVVELKTADLTIPEEIEINGLKISKKIIQDKIKEVKLMKITGVDDKAGYEAAVKAKGECVKLRTQSESWRKEKVKPINDALGKLKETIEGFGTEAKVGEDYLSSIIDPIDAEKKRIKEEKENEKLRVMQERISSIIQLGALFDKQATYTFPYDAGLMINSVQLKTFEDKEFKQFLSDVHDAWEVEQKRLDEEKKAAAIEKENTIKLAAQVKVSQTALKEKQTALRIKELKLMGFLAKAEHDQIFWHHEDDPANWVSSDIIDSSTDEEWEALIESLTAKEEPEQAIVHPKEEVSVQPFPEGSPSSGLSAYESEYLSLPKSAISTLEFNPQEMYKDVQISDKFLLRFYPDEYMQIGNMNVKAHAASGKVEGNLNFILIKK